MKPLYRAIIVIIAAIVLVAALGSAFNQIATSPILTKNLNTQDGDREIPTDIIPDINVTDPGQIPDLPDLNNTTIPPVFDIPAIPNGTDQNITLNGGNVSGTVFDDKDGNGLVDPGEGRADVGVQLYDGNGTLVGTTQTDASGNYNFTEVDPGKYNVSTFPGTNTNVIGGENRTIKVDGGQQDGIDLNATSRPDQSPAIDTITDITSPSGQFLIKKGVGFLVKGTVTTTLLRPVSGVSVMVFVAVSKTTTERYFIGAGQVSSGIFTANCLIPDELQLGNYQLIARSLGDSTYKPSESDPAVKVTDDTKLITDSPDRVIMGVTYEFNFTLLENASSKPVQHATLYLKELNSYNQTDSEGTGHFNLRWTMPGVYSLQVIYGGNSTLYGTIVNKTVTVLDISVEIAPQYLVRGYDNHLFVLVHASELPVALHSVLVYFEDNSVGAFVTDRMGRVDVIVPVFGDHALGPSKMVFDLPSIKRCEIDLNVKSMTTMKVTLEGNQVNATLLNDHNQAMLSMPILLQRSDKTNIDNGLSKVGSEFSLVGEDDYVVNFTGNSIYQPSSAVIHYSPPGWGSPTDWIIVAVLGSLAVLTLVIFMLFRSKRIGHTARGLFPTAAASVSRLPTSPYQLKFPQIAEDLPPVWGENDPMRFQVSGGTGELHMDIDGNGSKMNLESGSGEFTITLPKGDHLLSVSGPLGTTTVLVQTVDYREETVRLYREAFDSWKAGDTNVTDSMAPRELQSIMEPKLDLSRHGQLDVVISLFEIAEFSQRPVGRPEYESMYRAANQVS
ncbi:MAG TPA: SdrD B-like domain-containing protein [Methanomassiliicoccales archaeon]|jgi:hypothetical protein